MASSSNRVRFVAWVGAGDLSLFVILEVVVVVLVVFVSVVSVVVSSC